MAKGPGAGPGRPKGSPNKLTADIRAALLGAFQAVGGQAYLEKVAKEDSRTFCALLGKAMPMQIAGDPDNPLNVINRVERVIVRPPSSDR